MPPPIQSIPLPTTRGTDARDFLEYNGLTAIIPTIRSGHYETCLSDPFFYYLTSRLGLKPALSWSESLSRGGWLHGRARLLWSEVDGLLPPEIMAGFNKAFEHRCSELVQIGKSIGMGADGLTEVLNREKKDFLCAIGWFQAARQVNIAGKGTIASVLAGPSMRCLGTEIVLTHTDPLYPKTPIVATLDALLYNSATNELWIPDWKTTSDPAKVRLASCPIEQQTWTYMIVVKKLLPLLIQRYNLPADVKLGGMIHIAIEKPTIELSGFDRDFTIEDFTPSSGKNKGITRQEKKYHGEPTLDNYIRRCSRWYLAQGEYLDLAPEWAANPPVNFSYTHAEACLDEGTLQEYDERVALVYRYATCPPEPRLFPRSSSITNYGKLSPYAPFYLSPVAQWPEIIRLTHLIIDHRDSKLEPSPCPIPPSP